MSRPRRSFSLEYGVEAAHRVIDGIGGFAEVAAELDLHENLLISGCVRSVGGWPRPAGVQGRIPVRAAAFTGDERAELIRLRAKVAEQSKDIAFLEKASAYFAGKHPR